MKNLSWKTISELENVLKNFENEEFVKVQNCAIELRERGCDIMNVTQIANHFGLKNVNELFVKKNENTEMKLSDSPIFNEMGVLTEDKFDKDIIPTTKNVGMIGSVIIGGLMFFNGSWMMGLLYAIGGIMATLGLCVLLEGISTIIKLLRKISEK